jgi:hypothetical protein
MNPLMLLVIALVALCYCGGKLCPSVLRQNKEMLLGVAIGMALCSFMGLRMEGFGGNRVKGDTENMLRGRAPAVVPYTGAPLGPIGGH